MRRSGDQLPRRRRSGSTDGSVVVGVALVLVAAGDSAIEAHPPGIADIAARTGCDTTLIAVVAAPCARVVAEHTAFLPRGLHAAPFVAVIPSGAVAPQDSRH